MNCNSMVYGFIIEICSQYKTAAKSMKCDLLTLLTVMIYLLMEFQFPNCQLLGTMKNNGPYTKGIYSTKSVSEDVNDTMDNSAVIFNGTWTNPAPKDNHFNASFGNVFQNGSVTKEMEHNNSLIVMKTAFENRKKELPLAMIIAGPTAAVSICIFLCIAYYFHNAQLNSRAKRLSITLYVSPDLNSVSSTCSSPTFMSPQRQVPTRRMSRDSDIFSPRRKSTLSVHTPSKPASTHGKRGSNWSALADQEILSLSAPRRHSTFIL